MGAAIFLVLFLPILLLALLLLLLPDKPISTETIKAFLSSIESNSWITLVSALLTYYGTTLLALVTLHQNKQLNQMQSRDLKLREIELGKAYHPQPHITGFHMGIIGGNAAKRDPEEWKVKFRKIELLKVSEDEAGFGFYKGSFEVNRPCAVIVCLEMRDSSHFIKSFETRCFNVPKWWARPFVYTIDEILERSSAYGWKDRSAQINRRINEINTGFESEKDDPLRTTAVNPYDKAGSHQYHKRLDVVHKGFSRRFTKRYKTLDYAPNQPIYVKYIVEQGMEVKYRYHIKLENDFGIESTQGLDVYLALVENQLHVKVHEYDYGDYFYLTPEDGKVYSRFLEEKLYFDTLPNHEMDSDKIEFG